MSLEQPRATEQGLSDGNRPLYRLHGFVSKRAGYELRVSNISCRSKS